MKTSDLLHKIDKRLSVLEALSKNHNIETGNQFKEIKEDLSQMKSEVSKLKIRVAGVAAVVSLIISFILK